MIWATLAVLLTANTGLANLTDDFTWIYKTPMTMGRFAGGTAAVDEVIYTIGGHEGALYGRMNEAYNTTTDTWTTKAPLPHGDGRYGISAIAVGGKIYTFGGTNIWGNYNNDNIDEYDPSTDTWIANKAKYPVIVSVVMLAEHNGKIYSFGGSHYKVGLPFYIHDNVYEYDPSSNSLLQKASMPTARSHAFAGTVGDRIYVIGGNNYTNLLDVVEEYDIVSDTWSTKTSMPIAGNTGGAVINGKIYVYVYQTTSIYEYDPTTDKWTTKNPIQTPRHEPFITAVDNKLYVMGGYQDQGAVWVSSVEEGVLSIAEPSCGKLLVRSYNGSDWDLYIMDEDGSNLVPIDTGPSKAGWGDFSPDGKTILYTLWNGSANDFYQVSVAGGPPTLVGASLNNQAAVRWGSTPDRFFYAVNRGGPCGNYDMETHKRTYTLDAEGFLDELVSDEIILSAKNVKLWDINEDLNKMTCHDVIPPACWAPRSVIVTYNADGTNRQVLTATDDGKADAYPGISPDGEYIVFMKSDSASGWQTPSNIYRIRWDGTEQERLTNYVGDYKPCLPVWRDNDSLFYSVSPTAHEENDVLHYYTISTSEDMVVPCDLPNCQPLDFLMVVPVIEAAVDIKPGSCPNPLNVKSKGVLPVAILGSEDFDVTSIDVASIRLADVAPIRSSYEDVAAPLPDRQDECECTTADPDGYTDLALKFKTQEIVEEIVNAQGDLAHGERLVLTLTGVLSDETPIQGADCILVRGKFKSFNSADLNKDGVVDAVDFAMLAENWLKSSVVED